MNAKTAAGLATLLLAALVATYIIPRTQNRNKELIDQTAITELHALIQLQAKTWNQGDLDAFMNLYYPSDSLIFITAKKNSLGWQQLYNSYQTQYWENADLRGVLSFTPNISLPLDDYGNLYLIQGAWEIEASRSKSGKFSLIFKRDKELGWRIIADHTW